jgi:hypothetical protein
MTELPEPRRDGICCDCLDKPAVTNDGRWCKACLKRRIVHDTPMIGCYKGMHRRRGHKENEYETHSGSPGPWCENAVRALEES